MRASTVKKLINQLIVQVMGQYEEIVEVGAGGGRQEHSGPEELEVATRRERLPKEYSSYALSK